MCFTACLPMMMSSGTAMDSTIMATAVHSEP